MMSDLTFRLAYDNQTSAAQKVYGAVPIADSWTQAQIIGELTRGGIGLDYRVISACLSALVRAGLIQEASKGQFRRLPVRPAPAPKVKKTETESEPTMTTATPTAKTEAVKLTALDILTELSARAADIGKSLKGLVADIDSAAITISEQIEADSTELKKLRQLKALLKDLG